MQGGRGKNNRMAKTRDLLKTNKQTKKPGDTKGTFPAKLCTIKDRDD